MSDDNLKARALIMPRHCKACEEAMDEGYLHQWEETCFCSKECLHKIYKEDAAEELLEDKSIFWTDWYDEVKYLEVEE